MFQSPSNHLGDEEGRVRKVVTKPKMNPNRLATQNFFMVTPYPRSREEKSPGRKLHRPREGRAKGNPATTSRHYELRKEAERSDPPRHGHSEDSNHIWDREGDGYLAAWETS
jgi:hypothetical protein